MPVVRIDTTTATPVIPPDVRGPLLQELTSELTHGTENGPVIFEIPLGTDCFDVLVVWQKWENLHQEARASLIVEAYGDQHEKIAQATGATYDEAMQQQLLPYAITSPFENDLFVSAFFHDDKSKIKAMRESIRDVKLANGAIVPPYGPRGKTELRFPTRAMAEGVLAKLTASGSVLGASWHIGD